MSRSVLYGWECPHLITMFLYESVNQIETSGVMDTMLVAFSCVALEL